MTQDELTQAISSGKATMEENAAAPSTDSSPTPPPNDPGETTDFSQFIPTVVALQSPQRYLTAAPTFVPRSFQEQIQFVLDSSGAYWLYFYANNQWNGVEISTSKYGDGSDGDVVISVDTTLGRDMFYRSLTIQAGVTFKPNGFKVYSQTPINNAGHISLDGGDGGDGAAGQDGNIPVGGLGAGGFAGIAGVGVPTGSIKQPGNAVAGHRGLNGEENGSTNAANGLNGTNEPNAILPNSGPNGGNSGSGSIDLSTGFTDNHSTGGVGGTATRTTKPSAIDIINALVNALGAIGCNATSGSGAGGGCGYRSSTGNTCGGGGGGGGAGAAAGIGWFCAPGINVLVGGSITANGGKGGKGGDGGGNADFGGGGGGGGAPGNGGLIFLITPNYSNLGTVTATAGTPGNGGLGKSGGHNGSTAQSAGNGQIVQIIP